VGKSRVILPKKLIADPRKMAQAITNTLNATAKAIKVDFDVTAQTWRNKPTFAIAAPNSYTREISTDDEIYSMLNEGTPEHDIFPKPGKVLVFRTPFRSKTLPRQIRSTSGGQGGNVVFTRKPIQHPGTAPREFDKVIAEKWESQVGSIFQRAIDAAAH
jgi:hypothetical protein